ncbi:site-specific integrase [Pedobacter aquatilis]|uniref:tyrosine-type recombinase/integrase n=1 Tax=Pedobacter aquatilis TaxID=351343 RepID=UPI0025B311EC|nr:site-specific integrase [Pedobacter aquatilis]MDN3588456.1 site-specific integrase [Pedobacter aquatilis]
MENNDLEDFLPRNSDTSLPLDGSGTKNSPRAARRKNQNSSEENEKNIGYSERKFQGRTPRGPNFDLMEIPELPYTVPRVVKGRNITRIPVGSTLEREVAKQSWYVEFFFHNASEERMERIRVTRKLNRIKDPRQKLKNFNNLCEAYRIALEGGWNPLDEQANARLKKELIGIDLNEALVLFESYHKAKGTRPKSISTYRSTVNSFIKYHGGNKKVSTISDFEITDFLNFKEREEKWAGVTYNNCRIGLNNFFRYLKVNKYISENPVTDCETRKKMPTQSHQVFTERDFKVIMNWLDKHDKYCQLFVRMIYYTCIRPKELRFLQLKYIDLEENTITVPGTVSKNKKSIPVNIDVSLRAELDKLKIEKFDKEYFLLGSAQTFISRSMCSENYAYNRFKKCLEATGWLDKNYTLYSFKHLSNVRKFRAGWTLAEICSANRHSSLSETETYLKELLKFVRSDKVIPAI